MYSFPLYFTYARMFLSIVSIDACLANRAQQELEEHNELPVENTSASWLGTSWVPLSYHSGMGDVISALREFQKVKSGKASAEMKQ